MRWQQPSRAGQGGQAGCSLTVRALPLACAGAAAAGQALHPQPLQVHLLLSQHCTGCQDSVRAVSEQCQIEWKNWLRSSNGTARSFLAWSGALGTPPTARSSCLQHPPAASNPAASTAATSAAGEQAASLYCTSACSRVRLTLAASTPATASRAPSTAARRRVGRHHSGVGGRRGEGMVAGRQAILQCMQEAQHCCHCGAQAGRLTRGAGGAGQAADGQLDHFGLGCNSRRRHEGRLAD